MSFYSLTNLNRLFKIGSMDMDGSSGLLGSGSNHGISASSDQSHQGVRMGEPQTVPSALSRGQRRIESSPELQVACGGNAIWLGVGGGVFSSLTSVSPALSYYIGGTMIWAVAQTIRLLSDAPAATPATSSSSSSASQSDSSHSRGNTDARSTYVYTVLPALTVDAGTVSRTSSSSPSPSMALLSVLLKDVLSNGRFHCCAALMASLLAASSSSAFKDLLRARLLVLYLSQGDECPGVTGTEEESALAATRMAMAVASAFKLSRLVSMKSREREKERESHALSAKLSQTLLPPYMRVKCEREMAVREQAYSTLNNEGRDICSTLVASDIISIVLSDAQTYRSSSRVVFHSAAEITAQAIRQQDSLSLSMDDTDIVQQRVRSVSTLLTTLSANPSPFPSPTLKDRAQPPARVLPDAVHAVCNIDTGGLTNGHTHDMSASSKNSADESGAASDPTVRVMLCSVCVAMLLTGDADGAGAVAALLLDRPDIKAVCSVLSHSNSRSNSNFSTNATASVPVPVPDSSPSSGAAVDSAEVERALEPVEEQEQEQRRGAAEERSSDGVAAAVHSALSFFFGASGA